MKVFLASVLALALAGCALQAETGPLALSEQQPKGHQASKQKPIKTAKLNVKEQTHREAAAPPMAQEAAMAKAEVETKIQASKLLNAVVIDETGKPVGRVEDLQLAEDGKPGLVTIVHGAEGSGTATVMIPFSQFKVVRGSKPEGEFKLQISQVLKPLPEFVTR